MFFVPMCERMGFLPANLDVFFTAAGHYTNPSLQDPQRVARHNGACFLSISVSKLPWAWFAD